MASKFGRNYNLVVQTIEYGSSPSGVVSFGLPFTLEFDIQRNNFSSCNTANVRAYNLAPATRGQIYKDQQDFSLSRNIILNAGYGTVAANLPILFAGQLSLAWSFREGTNVITQMESLDAADAAVNSLYSAQHLSNTPVSVIVTSIINSMRQYGVTPGTIGNLQGSIQRGNSYSGTSKDILNDLIGNRWFIDGGVLNVLGDNEALPDPTYTATQILNTPLREGGYNLNVDILFEPSLKVGQMFILKSSTAANFNGTYKIISLKHKGIISPVKCGDAVTSVGLLFNKNLQKVVG